MTTSLLSALGLALPARGLPGSGPPRPSGGPTGPIRAPGVTPRDEVPGPRPPPQQARQPPKPNEPTDAEIAAAKAKFAADPAKGAEPLAVLAAKIGDRARRDPIVSVLRDGLSRIHPFKTPGKAKEALDKGLDELLNKGLAKGFLKVLEVTLGKKSEAMIRSNDGTPTPGKPYEAPGEIIVTKDTSFGKGSERTKFGFEGAPLQVKPGQAMTFTVWTPGRWDPKKAYWKNNRVVIGRKADGTTGKELVSRPIDKKGANLVTLTAPDVADTYLLYVVAGAGAESQPQHDLKVGP